MTHLSEVLERPTKVLNCGWCRSYSSAQRKERSTRLRPYSLAVPSQFRVDVEYSDLGLGLRQEHRSVLRQTTG